MKRRAFGHHLLSTIRTLHFIPLPHTKISSCTLSHTKTSDHISCMDEHVNQQHRSLSAHILQCRYNISHHTYHTSLTRHPHTCTDPADTISAFDASMEGCAALSLSPCDPGDVFDALGGAIVDTATASPLPPPPSCDSRSRVRCSCLTYASSS